MSREITTAWDRIRFLLAATAVVIATIVAARLVLSARTGTADSYYYFARAAQLAEDVPLSETTINWGRTPEGGFHPVDRKFFPGYPLLLARTSAGTAPDRSWKTLAVLLVLVNPVLMGLGLRRLGLGFGAACTAVAMYATCYVPLRWGAMPMAETSALFALCLSAWLLPERAAGSLSGSLRFLASCGLGGLAILCRAEAAWPAAALGLVGVARIRGSRAWAPVALGGIVLGLLPFVLWLRTLPPDASELSRLHYVNEFFREFAWSDQSEGKGGFLTNFLRSWWHPVFAWDHIPFAPHVDELPALRVLWICLWLGMIVAGLVGVGGARGRWFAVAYLGFVVFRSLWYYPYDRFLVTGLPMGFAACALVFEGIASRGRPWAIAAGCVAVLWIGRGLEAYLQFSTYSRLNEVSQHFYRDDLEVQRLRDQMEFTSFPLDTPDMSELAARRYSRQFASRTIPGMLRREVLAREAVAIEFPWPMIAYMLRPRPVVVGYPLENFWGDSEYRAWEFVPEGPDGKPIREKRRAIDYLRDKGVRYVITRLPRVETEAYGERDLIWGVWTELVGLEGDRASESALVETFRERKTTQARYEWPMYVRVLALW